MSIHQPSKIYEYLSSRVLGQKDVLKTIAVGIYKHINGVKMGNMLLIGNSGTGKTTIMKTIRQYYYEFPELEHFRAMTVMNANTLVDENGEVNLNRIFANVEMDIRNRLGDQLTLEELKPMLEHATVCLDEVDKISSRIAGKTHVTGIAIQQALLTILEGEQIPYETLSHENGQTRKVRMPLNTAHMIFIAGGAFEELFDQVYKLVENRGDDRRLQEENRWNPITERLEKHITFSLKEYLKISDLFTFGMVPQFIARFSGIGLLEDLKTPELRQILLTSPESPFVLSREYFGSYGIELRLDDDAADLMAAVAELNSRIGARALREVFAKIISDLEFDPFQSGLLKREGEKPVIHLTRDLVKQRLYNM